MMENFTNEIQKAARAVDNWLPLLNAAEDALDSLEYARMTYPNALGYGIRDSRILELKRVIDLIEGKK
jgi:hypothetical protein